MAEVSTAKELREQSDEDLHNFLNEKSEELFKLRFQHHTGQLENTARLQAVRKEIARAKTIAAQRKKGA